MENIRLALIPSSKQILQVTLAWCGGFTGTTQVVKIDANRFLIRSILLQISESASKRGKEDQRKRLRKKVLLGGVLGRVLILLINEEITTSYIYTMAFQRI